ncbi:MAG: hypothetical protein IJ622_12475 [Bacteroidales bacterium]|nr:hypothetical protein [Bacteroidales bacterium]
MSKISRWLCFLSTLITINLYGQEVDFAKKFSIEKFNKRINRDINRQIRRKGYKEMKTEVVERYFIYNLSRNTYASWESLRDYSFLDSCELRTYMDFDGKKGDLRIGGPVFAYLYRPDDSLTIAYLEGKQLWKAHITEHFFNPSFFLLRDHRMDYLFKSPIFFPDKSYAAPLFGVKDNKVYKIYSVKDGERHTYTNYCIPIDVFMDYIEEGMKKGLDFDHACQKLGTLDLKQYE